MPHCSLPACMSRFIRLAYTSPPYCLYLPHQKERLEVDGPCSGVCRAEWGTKLLSKWRAQFCSAGMTAKERMAKRRIMIRIYVKRALSHSVLFSPLVFLFFTLLHCPHGTGNFLHCNLRNGLLVSLSCHLPFVISLPERFPLNSHISLTVINLFSMPRWPQNSTLSLFLSLSGFLSLLSVCLQHVCDEAAWQEGRQADGHWDAEWLRSGASVARGGACVS